MDAAAFAERLERNGRLIVETLASVPESQACWSPDPARWSLHVVACHLLDEERLDFRARLRSTLEDPTVAWPAIDPEGWVTAHDYASWSWDATRSTWAAERADSVAWLRSLDTADWQRTHQHPAMGPLRAGDLMLSWEQHDYLHLRQALRLLHDFAEARFEPYEGRYAGGW